MGIDLSRVKGLCFDVDGTISDTDDAWVERLTQFFQPVKFLFKNGNPQPFARWLAMVQESPVNYLYYVFDRFSLDDNVASMYDSISKKRKKQPKRFKLMQGTKELLDLVGQKYPLTVVTARDERSTHVFLDQFELGTYFKEIVASQTCEYTKPFPHPVRYAAKSMGLNAQNCIMIGDTTVDILAGKAAGAQTIGLLCGFGTEKELRKAGADLILNDLNELLNLFTSIQA